MIFSFNFLFILLSFILVCFILSIDAGNKHENGKSNSNRKENKNEHRSLKKEGKKIKKNFSAKFEQIYFSICPDCYIKMNLASNECSNIYSKLKLSNETINNCKTKVNIEKLSKKRLRNAENSTNEVQKMKSWRTIFERENKVIKCLFNELHKEDKYSLMSKEELRRDKNYWLNQLLQDKYECIKRTLRSNGTVFN